MLGTAEPAVVRSMLAALFLFGSLGTAAELVLLEHNEDIWQLVPLVLIGIGCVSLAALTLTRAGVSVRAFQLAMVLFIASGIAGVLLHYEGNVEFELELRPGAAGLELFWEAMKRAIPALAPGTMILLGALGLACTYHYPAVRRPRTNGGRPSTCGCAR
ncbi:MAG: hypothetical protein GEU82_09480 [Luteitalea sp.]|nr:hypothetical protein [Luteitalea sp.]